METVRKFLLLVRELFSIETFFFFFFCSIFCCVCHSRVSSKEEKEEGVEIREQTRANLQRVGEVWKFDDITHRNYEMPWRISASCIGFHKRHALPLFSLPLSLSFSRGNLKVWEILDASGRASGRLLTRG